MKNNSLIIFLLAIIATSCGQQKFAFRKTVKVKQAEQASVQKEATTPKSNITKSTGVDDLAFPSEEKNVAQSQSEVQSARAEAVVTADEAKPEIDATPQWKQADKSNLEETTNPIEQQKTMDNGSGFAVAGFVLSLVGLLVAAVPCGVLAIIFGALGLKSSRKGLATAALIIGIIDVVVGLILISRMQ